MKPVPERGLERLPEQLACRRAIEALRNGVPNRAAVRILGSTQPHAEQQFQARLNLEEGENPGGLLISGDFGTGKSHLLEHFEHLALERDFVCSRIAVSKETPFYDLGKMFRAAADSGALPDGRVGAMVDEIGNRLAGPKDERYARFFQWADSTDSRLHRIFPATLMVHERLPDQDMLNAIRWFWSGDKVAVSDIKRGLRQIGQQGTYTFRAPKLRDLPPQRLRFVLEMIKAGGYRGWVVLIDELELVGSYSLLQRARSYAELARWMGAADDASYPGLVVVAAITEDFVQAILEDKGDRLKVPARLRERGEAAAARQAELGMQWLASRRTRLSEVTDDAVDSAVEHIRHIYSRAYDWVAPPVASTAGGAGHQRRMRYKVRTAITTWDLQRLRPDSDPDIETEEFHRNYREDRDLEVEFADDTET